MAVHFLLDYGDRRGSVAAASTSGHRHVVDVDVEVVNLEMRLSPVFEYLLSFFTRAEEDDGEVDGGGGAGEEEKKKENEASRREEEIRALLSSAVQDALEEARGGFLDAHALVLDALFFAWVKDMPIAIPCDPFLARAKWKLSTNLFASLVKGAGLESHLKQKLRNVLEHVFQHLAAELLDQSVDISDISHDSAHVPTERASDDDVSAPTAVPTCTLQGEAWSACKQSISRWERLKCSSSSNATDVASAVDIARRAVGSYSHSGRLTGSMLLCSSRFHASRSAVRLEETRRATVERELIAVLNRITGGDTRLGNDQGLTTRSSDGEDDVFLAAALLNPLLTAPQMTLSRLIHVAAKHASQAPFLLLAFSAQPGLASVQLEPTEPPFMLTLLARVLRNPPSELGGFNQLLGITTFAAALFQKQRCSPKKTHDASSGVRGADPPLFGQQRLAVARRSHLDQREGLLMTVLPVLFCQTNDSSGRDAGGPGSGSEGEYRALEILHSLFVGHNYDATDSDDDPTLSSSGLKLLKATFPGGILLALASYVDSRGADGLIGNFRNGAPSSAAARAAPERTRDLATSLLRSCVRALREAPPFTHHRSRGEDKKKKCYSESESSVLTSLAIADAAAVTQLTWHTRLLLEPVMGQVRKLNPEPRRTSPLAPPRFDASSTDWSGGDIVGRLAVAFGDLIRLCSTCALSTADVLNRLLRRGGGEERDGVAEQDGSDGLTLLVDERIEMLRNTDSPASLRSALLMACARTLPGCTMKEFECVLLREFLPGVLMLIGRRRFQRGSVEEDLVLTRPVVADFLTRVLLTRFDGRDDTSTAVAAKKAGEEVATILSRQLVVTINECAVDSSVDSGVVGGASLAFFQIRCLNAVLSRLEQCGHSRGKEILRACVLNIRKNLSQAERLAGHELILGIDKFIDRELPR